MIKAIIIDDVAEARNTLKRDIADYCPEVTIIGEANGVVEGAKVLQKLHADVIFLDIQMQDGSGFDLLEIVQEKDLKVIFTTASDAHAIKAFRFSAIDYLLKPIDPDELKQAIVKLKQLTFSLRPGLEMLSNNLKSKTRKSDKIALHSQDKIHIVSIADIIRCESNGNYTQFFFSSTKPILVTRTLKEFEEILSDNGFFRVHNSHLVNTKHMREYVKSDGGYIVMQDNSTVAVASRKRAEVIQMIEEL